MAYIPKDARWYIADVVLEHRVDGDPRNLVHVNIHLIEADSPEQTPYEKAIALGRAAEQEYTNTAGREVRVRFRGLRNLNVIHDELIDGAELTYEESCGISEDTLAGKLRSREYLAVFSDNVGFGHDIPNIMPESVMKMMEEAGFDRREIELET